MERSMMLVAFAAFVVVAVALVALLFSGAVAGVAGFVQSIHP